MNDEELEKIWRALDTRITTINERTKKHTIEIKELKKRIDSENRALPNSEEKE